jgi:hypothetical protein
MIQLYHSFVSDGWLLLVHQLPATPAYLRVKVARQLERVGAVSLKSTVYALPAGGDAREDLSWIRRDIVASGGDAMLIEATLVEGLSDDEMKERFRAVREPDYEAIAADARALGDGVSEAEVARLERRLAEVMAIDPFGAAGRDVAARLVAGLRARRAPARSGKRAGEAWKRAHQRKTWVTREGIKVDRIASAWLIRRFVDARAKFRFVERRQKPSEGEIAFDMFDGELSHDADLCTFEVICARLESTDRALRAIAEIVHDLDLKDGKFGRAETAGVGASIAGLCAVEADDAARLTRGAALFDALYAALGDGA